MTHRPSQKDHVYFLGLGHHTDKLPTEGINSK
jgi:hypothetical protein